MRRAYEEWNPNGETLTKVAQANVILQELADEGYTLTLRQLYYQFVARGLLENKQREYKNLGATMVRARMAGLTDWDYLEDRTRSLVRWVEHRDARHPLEEARERFNLRKWERQPEYVEVWIEKDALAGVFRRICSVLEVPLFACRGYPSKSEMHEAALRIRRREREGKRATILHFGDHDPSGLDMTRDIRDQMRTFGASVAVDRLALNMDQVDEYDPPANPAKLTDSRSRGPDGYVARYGRESWELDALTPSVLEALVRDAVTALRDEVLWEEALEEEEEAQAFLDGLVDRYDEVVDFLAGAP